MRARLSFLLVSLVSLGAVHSAPVDLSAPANSLGAANAHGYVQIWREIDEVDFGGGLKLPFRIRFSSEPQKGSVSPPIGVGFWCPLAHATAYLKRERMLRCELPCGNVMYLRRDKNDVSKFYTLDKEWTGVVEGGKISVSRPDGWELRYENGLLRQLKTDSGRFLTWYYDGNMLSEIREEGKATSPFKMVMGSGGIPDGISINGKLHSFLVGQRPRIEEIAAQRVVSGFDPALAIWKWPDGKRETFLFETDSQLQPNLKLTDSAGVEHAYAWNAADSKIASSKDEDGEWTYEIGKTNSDAELPGMERKSASGESEYIKSDTQKGITEKRSRDGKSIVTETFVTPGPLYGKVRKVEIGVGDLRYTSYQGGYDETGKLTRKIETDKDGFSKVTEFDGKGKIARVSVRTTKNPEVIKRLLEKEGGLLAALKAAGTPEETQNYLSQLCKFYLFESRDFGKVDEILAKMEDKMAFALRVQRIDNDPSLNPSEKIAKYMSLADIYPQFKSRLDFIARSRGEEKAFYAESK